MEFPINCSGLLGRRVAHSHLPCLSGMPSLARLTHRQVARERGVGDAYPSSRLDHSPSEPLALHEAPERNANLITSLLSFPKALIAVHGAAASCFDQLCFVGRLQTQRRRLQRLRAGTLPFGIAALIGAVTQAQRLIQVRNREILLFIIGFARERQL